MISSRLFTTLLKYKINNDNYDNTCEQLLTRLRKLFEEEEFTQIVNIISADYTYKYDKSEKPNIEIVVMIYATVDSTIETDKGFRKLFKAFIDSYCSEFEDIDAELLSREVV